MLGCSSARLLRAWGIRKSFDSLRCIKGRNNAKAYQVAVALSNPPNQTSKRRAQGSDGQPVLGGTAVRRQSNPHGSLWHFQALKKSSNGVETVEEELKGTIKPEEEGGDGKKILCEFILQALFNFLSCSAVAMAVKNSGGNAVLQTVQIMGAHAVILPLVIYSGLEISGAHFNPMVTACFVATGKLPAKLGAAYVAAQLSGGILGATAAFSSLPSSMQTLAHAGIQQVPATSSVSQAFFGEIYASFAFIFVLFGTNVDPRGWGKLKPMAVPLIICLLMWIVGPVSSMCINPARAFGPAVVTGFWEHHWIWWTAPFIGGVSAAKVYHSLFLPKAAK